MSLWDGEGLFQNLELDLDVLEKELNLPFVVLSGHINQLLIRVPWTKLGSEAVKITIDTIGKNFFTPNSPSGQRHCLDSGLVG